jgi:hypothetical protein
MNGSRIKDVFAGLGKIIALADIGAADASGCKAHLVATLQQFGQQAGGAEQFDDFARVVIPLQTRMQPTVAALDRVAVLARASAADYLRVIGAELGQPAAAATSSILDALKASMIAASLTVAPSGAFASYFASAFGYTGFPTSGDPEIEDAWVSSEVVIV